MIPRYITNFSTESLQNRETDYLVIGSGIAGLYSAVKASEKAKVTLLTKRRLIDTNTEKAQGGIASAIHPADSPALHRADTLEAGAGLCNISAVEVLVSEGPDRVMELINMGANFDRLDGKLAFTREAAHSRRRILHAGDSTGEEIQRTLARYILNNQNINFFENQKVIDLLTDGDRCYGALVKDGITGEVVVYRAKAVVLAAGGAGQVFKNTTNPEIATGDGIAMAYRAGAEIADVEFVQFHPTALLLPGAPRFLISEAVRGEGAILRNINGERFMPKYHPGAELASRDIVARAITNEMLATGSDHVYLDLSPMAGEKVKKRFPTITRTCAQYGIDVANEMIPVAPAAHYMMGGIRTNLHGETTIKGLYACGEVACPGVHGANRLASNSLLDGLVYGHRIIKKSMETVLSSGNVPIIDFEFSGLIRNNINYDDVRNRVREIMWNKVGIMREAGSMQEALEEIRDLQRILFYEVPDSDNIETSNILTVAGLITQAALTRTESRGGHFRKDYKLRDDVNWKKHICFNRDKEGETVVTEHELS